MGKPAATSHVGGHLLLLALNLAMSVLLSDGLCIPSEREALLTFKRDLTDPDNLLSTWVEEPDTDCCKWYGVVCNNSTGHVLQLRLFRTKTFPVCLPDIGCQESNGMAFVLPSSMGGKLNPSLLNLNHLTRLDLPLSNFSGAQIPSFLGSMRNLRYLDLANGGFGGVIPSHLGNLTSLISLNLSNNPFSASIIPRGIFGFKHLEVLKLGSTSLHGSIPEAIGNMTSLVYLDLSSNFLQGRIPHAAGNLTSLTNLYLSRNILRDKIPETITNSASLVILDLSSNFLVGRIPETIGKMTSLWSLTLSDNSLQGRIPESMGRLSSLGSLHLQHNQLYGPIPESIGGLLSLETLDLGNNQLSGTLPQALGRLTNLQQLRVSYNPMSGDVTEVHFANLTNLEMLSGLENKLSLKVSAYWVPPFKLNSLYLDSWQTGPQFPQWLQSQTNLNALQMSSAGILGPLPNWIENSFPRCRYFNLSRNRISGNLQGSSMISQGFVFLGSNQLSGDLPPISLHLDGLDVSNNSFSGNISRFLCDRPQEVKQLAYLNLQSNNLSGEIPNCWENWQTLAVINFENNEFTSKIPSSIGCLSRLKSLHLRNNHLNGELPMSLGNCTNLLAVDLAGNDFVGSIPRFIGERLASIKFLSLGSNRFSGQISEQLCALRSLQLLNLDHNNISGGIPSCFSNFTAMTIDLSNSSRIVSIFDFDYGVFSESAIAVTKSITLEYNRNLGLMTLVDLSSNNLSGEIPQELTSLIGLRSLNLSNNLLTGEIPQRIGVMQLLESVDFSKNQISGQIPLSLSRLTFLGHLNLSNNNLVGRIPLTTQLQTFDSTCFAGNSLCGPPLINSCSINDEVEGHGGDEFQGKGGDGLEMEGIYISMSIGFIVGFWLVWAPLLYKKSWRSAYLNSLDSLWQRVGSNCF